MIQFVINSQKEGVEKSQCKYILPDLKKMTEQASISEGKLMNDNRSSTCNVEIDCKKIKHGAYGKIAIFYVVCSEKHMAPN